MGETVVTVEVALPGRAYPIDIGPGAIGTLGRRLRERCGASRATVVTDANVGPLYASNVSAALDGSGFDHEVLTVPAGDASKSLDRAAELYDALARRGHGRDEPVIALGGGMVGDLGGFVAATWLRGVPLVQCPTTVMADVDASIGGKTAVNHPAGKNLIGVFHQPILVCIDVDCLATLSRRDFRSGFAESVKHAVIRDAGFFQWQEAHQAKIAAGDGETLCALIRRNCENKAAVVVSDERETAREGVGRAVLNFGHTIGHALEAQSDYELRHGEAVSLGMIAAMDLAVARCGFAEVERRRVESLLAGLGLPVRSDLALDVGDLLRRLGVDKKVRNLAVRFVLPTRIGAAQWEEAPPVADVERAIGRLIQV